jgi:hypothetical protein
MCARTAIMRDFFSIRAYGRLNGSGCSLDGPVFLRSFGASGDHPAPIGWRWGAVTQHNHLYDRAAPNCPSVLSKRNDAADDEKVAKRLYLHDSYLLVYKTSKNPERFFSFIW